MNDFKPLVKGAFLRVSGMVQKVVKRENGCKLVIQSFAPGLIVFANCYQSRDVVAARKIRKGSRVELKGKITSFGSVAVCLADCVFV